MKRSLIAALAAVVLTFVFSPSAGATRLYAPEYYPDGISGFNVGADGGLASIAGSSFPVGANPMGNGGGQIAFTPDGTRAAMAFSFSGGIQGLKVDGNGAITPAQPIVGNHKGGHLAISPDGRFAFQGIGSAPKGIDVYTVGADGQLTVVPGSPFGSAESFSVVAVSPDGKFLYAALSGGIRPFAINADGSLAPKPIYPASNTAQIQFSPDGRTLFWSDYGAQSLNAASVAADGSLTAVGSPLVVGSTFNGYFGVSPNGKFLYWSDYNGDTLSTPSTDIYSVNAFSIGANGALAFAGAASTGTTYRCKTVVVSPGSNYVYCGTDGNKVVVAPILATGIPGEFREVATWNAAEPTPFAFAPEFGGTAAFSSRATTKPLMMTFDGTGSNAPGGPVEDFSWSFGTGVTSSAATPRATYKFPAAGVYSVSLLVSRSGCANKSIYTGQTTVCNGSPTALKTVSVDTPPWITSLKVSPRTLSKKSKISFKLTESATVTFVVQKSQSGRLVGSSCKKRTRSNKSKKKCTRWVSASKKFTAKGKAGKTNKLKFTGKVKRVKIPKGSYRLYALAKDSAKQLSPSATAKFKVKKKS